MPAMLTRIPEKLVFDYNPVRLLRQKLGNIRPLAERASSPVGAVSRPPIPGSNQTCWTGFCPGCGRTVISAVTDAGTRTDAYYCGGPSCPGTA